MTERERAGDLNTDMGVEFSHIRTLSRHFESEACDLPSPNEEVDARQVSRARDVQIAAIGALSAKDDSAAYDPHEVLAKLRTEFRESTPEDEARLQRIESELRRLLDFMAR